MIDQKNILEPIPEWRARQYFRDFIAKYQNQTFAAVGGFISKLTIERLAGNDFEYGIRAHLCCDGTGSKRKLFLALERGLYKESDVNGRPVNDVPVANNLVVIAELYPDFPEDWINEPGTPDQGNEEVQLSSYNAPAELFDVQPQAKENKEKVLAWKANFKIQMHPGHDFVTYTNLESEDLKTIFKYRWNKPLDGIWYFFGYDTIHEHDRSFRNSVRVIVGARDSEQKLLFKHPAPLAERTYP